MSDRAAFMRQMGITDNDMKIDDPAPSRPVRGGSEQGGERRIKFATHCEYVDQPRVKRSSDVAAAAPPTSTATGSRAEFLRSLGIDNADPPAAGVSTPHASKEYMKKATPDHSDMPSQMASKRSGQESDLSMHSSKEYVKRAVQQSDSDVSRLRYDMPSAPPDLTLGQRRQSRTLSDVTADDDGLSAEQLKEQGNKAFDGGNFRKAIQLYGKAIEKDPSNAALYSNRSAAYLQGSKQMGIDTRTMALRDAEKAIALRPSWFKGYSRKGDALFKLEAYAEAAAAYSLGLDFDTGNINLMQSLQEAKKAAAGVSRKDRSAVSLAMEEADRAMDQRSVYDMVDELRESQRRTSGTTTTGHDYRMKELERFRTAKDAPKAPQSTHMSSSGFSSMSSVDSDAPAKAPVKASAPTAHSGSIPAQFNSDAAAAYQQELLERYRRKKGTK